VVGFASKVGAAGEVVYEAPDASLALLASISNSQSFDEAAMLDPARLEADIVNQLYLGASVFMGDVSVSPLLRDRQVRSSLSPLASSASALFSPLWSQHLLPGSIICWTNLTLWWLIMACSQWETIILSP